MSYTKLEKDIERYYKSLNRPFYYDASKTSKEEVEERAKEFRRVRDIIIERWKKEKKYKELISVAHGGWIVYDEFTKPLAEYFVKENELLCLKFLCEKEIRSTINATLSCVRSVKEDFPQMTKGEMISYDIEECKKNNAYFRIGELLRVRGKALLLLDNYLRFLKLTNDYDYLEIIEDFRDKVCNLTIKRSELKIISHKLI